MHTSKFQYYRYPLVIGAIALVLGTGIQSNQSFKSISPCVIQLPVVCTDSLDKTRINYSVNSNGYPATFKKTSSIEQLSPGSYMRSEQVIIKTNPIAIIVDVLFWFLLLFTVTKLPIKKLVKH
jgi:hypothetical protein